MVDWSAIGANEPPANNKPVFYNGDALREKLQAIATVAAIFLNLYAGPGGEEDAGFTTIYVLANAALDMLPDKPKEGEAK